VLAKRPYARLSSRRASSRLCSGQPSFCDCRTRRARSRKPIKAARRLPVSVPSAFRAVPRAARPFGILLLGAS